MKTNLFNRSFAAGILLPMLALASTSVAAPRFVVKVADYEGAILIPGDSDEPGFEGWIDARAFGQSINRPVGETFVTTSRFTFHKALDSASPALAEAAATGKTLPAVIIQYLGEDGGAFAPVSVELNHVMVSGYRVGGGDLNPLGTSEETLPAEEITLTWSQVVLHYQDEATPENATSGSFTAYSSTEDPAFDDDMDGVPNPLDDDDDNDEIADAYENENGLNPFLDDSAGDLDGDGTVNGDEAVADTRANDGTDFFRIDSLVYRKTAEGPEAVVTLTVKPGRHYRLLATSDLSQPRASWFVVDQFEVAANDVAGPIEIVLNGPLVANAGSLFFAAAVDLADAP